MVQGGAGQTRKDDVMSLPSTSACSNMKIAALHKNSALLSNYQATSSTMRIAPNIVRRFITDNRLTDFHLVCESGGKSQNQNGRVAEAEFDRLVEEYVEPYGTSRVNGRDKGDITRAFIRDLRKARVEAVARDGKLSPWYVVPEDHLFKKVQQKLRDTYRARHPPVVIAASNPQDLDSNEVGPPLVAAQEVAAPHQQFQEQAMEVEAMDDVNVAAPDNLPARLNNDHDAFQDVEDFEFLRGIRALENTDNVLERLKASRDNLTARLNDGHDDFQNVEDLDFAWEEIDNVLGRLAAPPLDDVWMDIFIDPGF